MTEILETFPRVFCFRKSRINENGGKDIPLNVHQGTVVESAGELATALYEQEGITEDNEQELEASD